MDAAVQHLRSSLPSLNNKQPKVQSALAWKLGGVSKDVTGVTAGKVEICLFVGWFFWSVVNECCHGGRTELWLREERFAAEKEGWGKRGLKAVPAGLGKRGFGAKGR